MQLPSFPLVKWFASAEGRFNISLSHSDCEPLSVADLLNEHQRDTLLNYHLGYGPFAGLEELRQAVARQYNTIDKDDVMIFGGASEAIYSFMRATLSPGDEVVIQSPIFNSLRGTALAIGCKLIEWRATDEMTCSFDATLEDQIGGQLDAGFVIRGMFEDRFGEDEMDLASRFFATFIATRASKP